MLWAVGSKWAPQASPLLSLQLWWQQIRHLSNTNPNTNTNTKTNKYKYKWRFRYKHKWVPWATPPITVVLVGYTNGRHLSCLKCNSSPSTIYPLNLKCLPRSLNWKCIPFNCVCACICTWNKCYLAILSGKRQLYFPAIFRLPSSSDNRWGENLNNLTRKIETGWSLHCTQLYKCVPICTTYTSSNTSRAAMQMPLNNTSSDQSERSNTTARITQCHAATHTWALSSPGLSTNRDKQHEICADSALRGSGLLQDRTQGWVVSLHMSQFLTTGQKAFMSIIEIVET